MNVHILRKKVLKKALTRRIDGNYTRFGHHFGRKCFFYVSIWRRTGVLQWAAKELKGQDISDNRSERVRLSVLVPLGLLLVPGLVEFGTLLRANLALADAAHEAAEVAQVGGAPSRIGETAKTCRPSLASDRLALVCWHRGRTEPDEDCPPWCVLDASGGENNAESGEQIRVQLRYRHELLFGGISGPFFGASADHTVPLRASVDVVRK
jgi:hypothetical protein